MNYLDKARAAIRADIENIKRNAIDGDTATKVAKWTKTLPADHHISIMVKNFNAAPDGEFKKKYLAPHVIAASYFAWMEYGDAS